jgi:lysine biosynthesis protein LysW
MASTTCPECDAVIKVNNPRIGAKIRCHECNVELEVIATDPLDVYFAYDDDWGEDWDDDDD